MDLNFSGITPHFNSHDLKLYKNSRVTPFIKADMLDLLLHMGASFSLQKTANENKSHNFTQTMV